MTRFASIDRLLVLHSMVFLVLVALSAASGGAMIFMQHAASRDAIRDTEVLNALQGLRGDLYRQMKEVYDHVFVGDPGAPQEFEVYGFRIEQNLDRLRRQAVAAPDVVDIDALQAAYHRIRTRVQVVMQQAPETLSRDEIFRIFETDLEEDRMLEYETLIGATDAVFEAVRGQAATRLARLDWLAVAVLLSPLMLAAIVVLSARTYLLRFVAEPLAGLLSATEAYSEGKLEHKVPESGPAEFLALQRAVNGMAHELAQSRDSLLRAERQATLGELVPVMAHNIRNPLASIRATAQVADDAEMSGELRTALAGIVATVDRLEAWLSSLLGYLNPLRPRGAPIRLSEVAENAMRLHAHGARERDLTLCRGDWDQAALVWGDRHLLEQAVSGLISNAIDASPSGGRITMTVAQRRGETRLAILDHGPGMRFAKSPSGFAPGPTTKPFGTGLGVPFARKVCDLHGATLSFGRLNGCTTEASIRFPKTLPTDATALGNGSDGD